MDKSRGNERAGIDLAGTLPPNSNIMSEHHAAVYSVYHRIVLQTIIARNVVNKHELATTLIPQLNEQYNCNYRVDEVIEMINSKLLDMGFTISESSCDDGNVYYSFVNTIVDAIAGKNAIPERYLNALRVIINQVNDDENSDLVGLQQLTSLKDVQYLVDNHWLLEYVGWGPTPEGVTLIGGPRLLSELSNWLINEVGCPECPLCMDPVVGGLSCPHACGGKLHRGCAFRTLMMMESSDDGAEKGVCPNCKEKWVLDLSVLKENGRVYRKK